MGRFTLFFLAALLLLPACGGDDGSPSGGFNVTVEVVDAAGEPVPGLELAFWNDSPFLQDTGSTKAVGHIEWTQPLAARTRLTIEDIEGDPVRVLTDEEHYAGRHNLEWNGCDDDGTHQFSGCYTVRLQGFDLETGGVEYESIMDMWMVMGSFREDQAVGTTNAEGRIVLRDMRLFPHLYDRPAMEAFDETGESMGFMTLDADMVFLLQDPATSTMMRTTGRVTGDGDRLVLVLVWRPVQKAAEVEAGRAPVVDKRGEPPLTVWALRVFPNPFN